MVGLVDFRRVEDPPAKVLYRIVRQLDALGVDVDVRFWAMLVERWPKAER